MIRFRLPSLLPSVWTTPLLLLSCAVTGGVWAEGEPVAAQPVVPAKVETVEPILPPTALKAIAPPALPPAVAPPALPPADDATSDLVSPEITEVEALSLIKLGTSLTDRGDYDSAEIAFRQVLNAANAGLPETKSALLGLAHMHRKQGALTKAVAIYEKYLKEYPGDERSPDALLDLGRALRSMGAYRLAIARFYNVINSTLKLPIAGFDHYQLLARTAQFEIAETHFESGNYAEAGKFFMRLRLLDLAPVDRARAHFKAAYSLHRAGDLDGAVMSLRSFLEQWPTDENVPEARYLLAISLRSLNRSQEAFAAALELLRTEKSRVAEDPKRWNYWQRTTGNQLANDFFESGDILNANAIYSGLAVLSDDPAWRLPITYHMGLCQERLGDIDRARATYQTIVDTAGPTPNPDLAELVRMATWRMEHLAWRDQIAHQITAVFETTTGRPALTPAPLQAAALP